MTEEQYDGASATLGDVVEELQNIRGDMALMTVQFRSDASFVIASLLLLVGVVIGVGVGLVVKGWFR